MLLGFNTYPIFDRFREWNWVLYFLPVTVLGVIPVHSLLHPSWQYLWCEVLGIAFLLAISQVLFRWGLRSYQSTPILALKRQ